MAAAALGPGLTLFGGTDKLGQGWIEAVDAGAEPKWTTVFEPVAHEYGKGRTAVVGILPDRPASFSACVAEQNGTSVKLKLVDLTVAGKVVDSKDIDSFTLPTSAVGLAVICGRSGSNLWLLSTFNVYGPSPRSSIRLYARNTTTGQTYTSLSTGPTGKVLASYLGDGRLVVTDPGVVGSVVKVLTFSGELIQSKLLAGAAYPIPAQDHCAMGQILNVSDDGRVARLYDMGSDRYLASASTVIPSPAAVLRDGRCHIFVVGETLGVHKRRIGIEEYRTDLKGMRQYEIDGTGSRPLLGSLGSAASLADRQGIAYAIPLYSDGAFAFGDADRKS